MKIESRFGLIFALVALAQPAGSSALAGPALPRVELRGAITAHLTHDWELKALASEVEAGEASVWRSYAVFLPKVDFTANFDRFHNSERQGISRTARIDLTMPLFTSGRNVNLVLGTQSDVLALKYGFLSAEKRSAYAGVRTYIGLFSSRARGHVLQQNSDRLQQVLTSVTARYNAGLVDFGAVSQARAVLLQTGQELILAQTDVRQSEIDFESETRRAPPENIVLPDVRAFIPATLAGALEDGRHSHPDVLAARHRADAASRLADATFGAYLPQLNLTGSYERNFDNKVDDEWQVGLSLTVKLFDGESVPAVIEAKKQAQAIRFRALDAGRKVDREIRSSWHAYHSALESRDTALARLDALTSAADVAVKKHGAGLVSVDVPLRAEIMLGKARIDLFQLQAKVVLNGYRLGYATNLAPTGPILMGAIK